jgi:hypothetical protein
LLPSIENGMGGQTHIDTNHSISSWDDEVGCEEINSYVLEEAVKWLTPKIL